MNEPIAPAAPVPAPAPAAAPGRFHGQPGRFYPARNPEPAQSEAAIDARADQLVAEATQKAEQARNEQTQQREARDSKDRDAGLLFMRETFGNDYRAKIHDIKQALADLPPQMAEAVTNARLPNGRALLNHPPALEVFARLAEINKFRIDNRTAYMRDEAMREEYRDLVTKLENAVGGSR